MLLAGLFRKKFAADAHSTADQTRRAVRLAFFGGKGGVGKTTCSAAFALALAERGYRTLLVSTDPAHSTGDLLEVTGGEQPVNVKENLWLKEIDAEAASDRYIREVKQQLQGLTAPGLWKEVERQMDFAAASPGAEEAAQFDEMVGTILEADGSYDHLVFDTAPTGHTLRLMSLPELMGVWIEGMIARRKKTQDLNRMFSNIAGTDVEPEDRVYEILQRRKNRFAAVREALHNPDVTSFYFVLNPERLSIVETEKAMNLLHKYGVPVKGIVVNRVLPKEADGVFIAKRREQERAYVKNIAERFQGISKIYIPMKPTDIRGLDSLRAISELLWEGMFNKR